MTYDRAVIKLLKVVKVLHEQGYELIRICPSISPSGCYWQCIISTKDCFDKTYGLRAENTSNNDSIYYSTGAKYEYCKNFNGMLHSKKRIAAEMLKQYPMLKLKGKGSDPKYIKWYEKMLNLAKKGYIPYAWDDYYSCFRSGYIDCFGEEIELPEY